MTGLRLATSREQQISLGYPPLAEASATRTKAHSERADCAAEAGADQAPQDATGNPDRYRPGRQYPTLTTDTEARLPSAPSQFAVAVAPADTVAVLVPNTPLKAAFTPRIVLGLEHPGNIGLSGGSCARIEAAANECAASSLLCGLIGLNPEPRASADDCQCRRERRILRCVAGVFEAIIRNEE